MGVPGAPTLARAISAEAVDKLRDTYLPWLRAALASADDPLVWRRPAPGANSIGNLLLHLEGNVRQWILHGLAGRGDARDRDSEFSAGEGPGGAELLARLEATVLEACDTLLALDWSEEEWLAERTIQGFRTTGFAAVMHVVEHFAYHTGQIVWIVKAATGRDMGFYGL